MSEYEIAIFFLNFEKQKNSIEHFSNVYSCTY